MKKKILAILICVSLIASFAVGLTACDKKDSSNNVSNSETLGTAVAVAAGISTSGMAGVAEDTSGSQVSAGLNLSFGTDLTSTFAEQAYNLVKPSFDAILNAALDSTIESASLYINDNGVSVKKADSSDNQSYDAMYLMTVSYKDQDGNAKTNELKMYITAINDKSENVDIDTAKNYTFTAALYAKAGDEFVKVTEFSGKANYDKDDDVTKFNLTLGAGQSGVEVEAYATKSGAIAIDATLNISTAIEVDVEVVVGKLASGKYGATVDVDVAIASICEVEVDLTLVATSDDNRAFDATGNVEIEFSGYTLTANLTGYAKYVQEEGEDATIEVGLQGNAKVTQESK